MTLSLAELQGDPNEPARSGCARLPFVYTRGQIAVQATKPCMTQRDLSLAYTPGVAVPCLEIERDPDLAYKYTAKATWSR